MMGALSGHDPNETLRAVFYVLSRPRLGEIEDGLITMVRLKAACKKLKVRFYNDFIN